MKIETRHGSLTLPAFFPDATRGVVRTVGAEDLEAAGVDGLVVNVLHLMRRPGIATLRGLGGIHRWTGWNGPILSDSGGFQVLSMIRENPSLGSVRREGVLFTGQKGEKKRKITPEKCIQAQFRMGSDLMVCLDYCTHPDDPDALQRESVELTIQWAKQCREEFDRQLKRRGESDETRPKLFAVIQGGTDVRHRDRCAAELLEIGFDGYAFGGWPIDSEGNLLKDTLEHTAKLLPEGLPRYALGIGKPDTLVACARMGYNLFDCVIPTRDARHGRLFIFNATDTEDIDLDREPFFKTVYPQDVRYIRDNGPVSEACDCLTCSRYSLAYLHHLFTIHDALALRLATIHNLRFYAILMEKIRAPC